MRALFIGLGSIGARHLRNLHAACKAQNIPLQVVALRSSARPLPQDLAPLVYQQTTDVAVALAQPVDVAFITNPTNLHAQALQQLIGKVGTYFIEKPIFEHTDYSLQQLGLTAEQKAYVAAPMRWTGVYLALKQKLQALPVYSVRSLCSSYLPDWRKGVDYRTVYSAQKAMGGGVTLDLIHEWDYLVDLFGFPQKSCNMRGQFSHLEIDSDDLSVYIAQYPKFLCELHLDYFGRTYRRDVEVFTEQGTLKADFGTGQLTLADGTRQDYAEEANRRYEREMDYFIEYALHGTGESINSPQKALDVLKLSLGDEVNG